MQRILFAALLALPIAPAFAADCPAMSGGELYRRFCASCHGAAAKGDGPIAASLMKKPSDCGAFAVVAGERG